MLYESFLGGFFFFFTGRMWHTGAIALSVSFQVQMIPVLVMARTPHERTQAHDQDALSLYILTLCYRHDV